MAARNNLVKCSVCGWPCYSGKSREMGMHPKCDPAHNKRHRNKPKWRSARAPLKPLATETPAPHGGL